MLDNYLDYGMPIVNQKYVLEQMVEPESVFDKIEEIIVGRSQHNEGSLRYLERYAEVTSDAKDYAAWRIPQMQEKDEIYFDLIEYIDAVYDKSGQALMQEINGELRADAQLTGAPEMNIFMICPSTFDDFSVHECLYDR
jgi:AP-3 complex subunit mu